jgi:hypothetical protein
MNRLECIASMVDKCNTAADIGTDHGYVAEMLLKKGLCNRIIATDLNKGPLNRAAEIFKVPFHTYSKEELSEMQGQFSNSDFVKNIVGLDTVCERAAIAGSQSKRLIINKTVINSVTVAAAIDDYEVIF